MKDYHSMKGHNPQGQNQQQLKYSILLRSFLLSKMSLNYCKVNFCISKRLGFGKIYLLGSNVRGLLSFLLILTYAVCLMVWQSNLDSDLLYLTPLQDTVCCCSQLPDYYFFLKHTFPPGFFVHKYFKSMLTFR